MENENLIYWNDRQVGIDCGSYISWFTSAPREAIERAVEAGLDNLAKKGSSIQEQCFNSNLKYEQ